MSAEHRFQVIAGVGADKHFLALAARVENQQGDVAGVVAGGELPALCAADVGDQVLQLSVVEIGQCRPRLALQSLAGGALRIVDLDNRRNPVADLRQVMFPVSGVYVLHQVPAATAHDGGHQRAIAQFSQNIAPAGWVPGTRPVLGGRSVRGTPCTRGTSGRAGPAGFLRIGISGSALLF